LRDPGDCPGTEWPPEPDLRLSRWTGFEGRTLLLVAGFPYERAKWTDPGLSLAIEEAVLSLCRAVFEAKGRVACRVDEVVAPFVLEVAAEYRASEPNVLLIVTHPGEFALAEELDEHPWSTIVPFAQSEREPTNMTRETVALVEPQAAVAIGDLVAQSHDLDAVRSAKVEVHLVEPTLVEHELDDPRDRGVMAEFLGDAWYEERVEIPFPYLMQRLVRSLGGY
jgi:hypothetical protein